MAKYHVRRVKIVNPFLAKYYWEAQRNAVDKYFNTLKEAREYCGGKLHKWENGWHVYNGNYEYFCKRI